jgi:putative transposase
MLSSAAINQWYCVTVQLRYNYRVYPTPSQQCSLAKAFGCARVVFNDGLRARQQARAEGLPYPSDAELSKRITAAKLTPERAWLGEVSAVVLQQALTDLNMAYRNFFASITGKRKGRKVAPPRFRSRKDNRQAIRFTANARFKVLDNGRLRLPKIGDLDVRWSRSLPAEPSSVTVIRDAAGRYFASFVVQAGTDPLPEVDPEVGIDLGLTHFAVLSDGRKVAAPKFLRQAARRLRRLQQALSRKKRGSRNRKKAVVKVARAHARVADTRRDWQHKLSTAIIRDNQAVYVEDLCVVLSPSPTGVRVRLDLSHRWWDCPCGQRHDRDVAAAQIILAVGRTDKRNACGAQVRPAAMPAPRREAGIRPDAAWNTRRGGNLRPLGRGDRQVRDLCALIGMRR